MCRDGLKASMKRRFLERSKETCSFFCAPGYGKKGFVRVVTRTKLVQTSKKNFSHNTPPIKSYKQAIRCYTHHLVAFCIACASLCKSNFSFSVSYLSKHLQKVLPPFPRSYSSSIRDTAHSAARGQSLRPWFRAKQEVQQNGSQLCQTNQGLWESCNQRVQPCPLLKN